MGAVDYFLKIEGIEGESQDSKHKGEIAVLSWNWIETQERTTDHSGTGGGGVGKVQWQDLNFTALYSKASPNLFLACATGGHFTKAVLTCRKAGKEQYEFLKIVMSYVVVSSFETGGSADGDTIPINRVSLNFGSIEQEYKIQKEDGSLGAPIKTGYSLKLNKTI